MGDQRNLTEENVDELKKKLEKMKINNPDLEYRFWEQDEKESLEVQKNIKEINEKLDSLERLIKHTFGGHILIDGEFKQVVL